MKNKTFNRIVKKLQRECDKVLVNRKGDYSFDGDRLVNFKVQGVVQQVPASAACFSNMAKHIAALTVYVEQHKLGEEIKPAQWLEKLGDLTNYSYLMIGCLIDEGVMQVSDLDRKDLIFHRESETVDEQ